MSAIGHASNVYTGSESMGLRDGGGTAYADVNTD